MKTRYTHRTSSGYALAWTLAILVAMPIVGNAEEVRTLEIGDRTISYDRVVEADENENGVNDRTTYYLGEEMVFTAYDENENGKADLWLGWKDGESVELELADQNGDGTPDSAFRVTPEEVSEPVSAKDADGARYDGTLFILGLLALVLGTIAARRRAGSSRT